jgi:hypothetical protein
LYVARGVKDSNDLQRLCFVAIDDQIRIDEKELVPLVRQFLTPVTDAGIPRQLEQRSLQSIKNKVGGLRVVVGDVTPNVADILPGAWGENESFSSFSAPALRAAPPDFGERLWPVHELAAVGLLTADSDLTAELLQPKLLQLLAFLEQAQGLPHHFALRLVQTCLEKAGNELVELRAEVDVHAGTIAEVNSCCQRLTTADPKTHLWRNEKTAAQPVFCC